jgi:hypothetical protein
VEYFNKPTKILITKNKEDKLIEIYFYICEKFEKDLKYCCQRYSNNNKPEFTDQETMYYYGVKLHALAYHNKGHLPFPEELLLTPASENNLNVFRNAWSYIENRTFYGDKIYLDKNFFHDFATSKKSVMLTPVKGIKNQSTWEKQFDKASNDLFSTAVSKVRQPIESLFNWFIEKTDFQRASKVLSTKGLIVHVFGKIAAAFIYLIFNS